MRANLKIFLWLAACLWLSCNTNAPEMNFKKRGVSFICPSGWKITDEDSMSGGSYYLSIEKSGFNESGLFTLSWVNDSLDLYEYADRFREAMHEHTLYKNSDLVFNDFENDFFNRFNSISSTYKVTILKTPHEGIIHAFFFNGKSFALVKQQATEDALKNEAGFSRIEKSFSVE